jgi:crossover junction endodeoxyribonuclease RuvC
VKAWIGIDPGKTGAAALLMENGMVEVWDFDGVPLAGRTIVRWHDSFDIEWAALEKVHSMPRQGVISTFAFGANWGAWQGILSTAGVSYCMVTPQEWQKTMVRRRDGETPKERALAAARRMFPGHLLKRKKDHNRADALLLAAWVKEHGI